MNMRTKKMHEKYPEILKVNRKAGYCLEKIKERRIWGRNIGKKKAKQIGTKDGARGWSLPWLPGSRPRFSQVLNIGWRQRNVTHFTN